jgi:hypothetical protein
MTTRNKTKQESAIRRFSDLAPSVQFLLGTIISGGMSLLWFSKNIPTISYVDSAMERASKETRELIEITKNETHAYSDANRLKVEANLAAGTADQKATQAQLTLVAQQLTVIESTLLQVEVRRK